MSGSGAAARPFVGQPKRPAADRRSARGAQAAGDVLQVPDVMRQPAIAATWALVGSG
jgi:hypothetical protein